MKTYRILTIQDKRALTEKAISVDTSNPGFLRLIRDDGTEKVFNMANVISWEEAPPADPNAPRFRPPQDPPMKQLIR
jgi:hypothetical protein